MNTPSKLKKLLTIAKSPSQKTLSPRKSSKSSTKILEKWQDIFDLGFMLMISATGGLQILAPSLEKPLPANSCCVIHALLSPHTPALSPQRHPGKFFSPTSKGTGSTEKKKSETETLSDSDEEGRKGVAMYFSNNRFSDNFLSFLCHALRVNQSHTICIDVLKKHPWMKTTHSIPHTVGIMESADVTLQELITIANQWRQPPIQFQGPAQRQLQRVCDAIAVLLSCSDQTEFLIQKLLIQKDHSVCSEFAKDLGLNLHDVAEMVTDVVRVIQTGSKENNDSHEENKKEY
jgi:hypothetical protein